MTLTVNFNMASGKQSTLRLSHETFDMARKTLEEHGCWAHIEDGTYTYLYKAHIESITARPV